MTLSMMVDSYFSRDRSKISSRSAGCLIVRGLSIAF